MHSGASGISVGIEREGWIAAAVGLGLALLAMAVPFVHTVFSAFTTLVHEMGHAAFGWLYGYPSIPAFDFTYGGGVTLWQTRRPALAWLVQAGLLALVYLFRSNPRSRWLAAGLCGAYALTAWSGLHRPIITAMGHGFELLFAGLFLHRALSGNACRVEGERPLYAFLGFFVTFSNLRFAWKLVTDMHERAAYEMAKGGGHWMDFSVLAEQHLHVPLQSVALLFFVACWFPPLLALLVNLHREAAEAWVSELRRVE